MIIDINKPDNNLRNAILDALAILEPTADRKGGSEEFYREALARTARWLKSQLAK